MKPLSRLQIGPSGVRQLLPHRPPMQLVDRVTGYEGGQRPMLSACRFISASEEVLAGHFPDLPIWPGVLIIEGLGQSCLLLHLIWSTLNAFAERGHAATEVLTMLQGLDETPAPRGPETQARLAAELLTALKDPRVRLGFSAAVDMKFLQPVLPGCRLDYQVCQTHVSETIVRFEVEAFVDGAQVARGTHHSTRGLPRRFDNG